MMLLTAAPAPATNHGPLNDIVFFGLLAILVTWLVVYFVIKVAMTQRRDFGLPVRRRLLCRKLRVHNDQTADVPFWWSDLQVQRAVRTYWRRTLRSPFGEQESTPAI